MSAEVYELPSDADRQHEQSLLSATMWARPAQRHEALSLIDPRMFTVGALRTMWESVASVHGRDPGAESLHPNDVMDDLERRGHLGDVGGPAASTDLLEDRYLRDPVKQARAVAERARRRWATIEAKVLADELQSGAGDTRELLHGAVGRMLGLASAGEQRIITARSQLDEVRALRDEGVSEGLRCGWGNLDRIFRPETGQLAVVTGVPSHGKSTWLDHWLIKMATKHGWRTAFFSPERKPVQKHIARLMVTATGEPLEQMSDERLDAGNRWVDDHFVWIDDTTDATVEGIVAAAQLEHDKRPLRCLVVDPWNWVEQNKPRDVTTTEYIGQALNGLTRAAQQHDWFAVVVAHPTKMRQIEVGADEGKYYVPRPYDISDSANWFNKPWWCLTVWRDHLAARPGEPRADPERNPLLTDVHVMKARDDDQGQNGTVTFRFDEPTRRFFPLEERAL